ncbi:ABC-type nitrate/sulfonate/bicarbonate transport system substrate-binding protein [Prauserella muralis]|nr:ABC-type nitrate/sulfonate/bicarbonate transport system substrate-binding protein [Prauserella muralis]
MRIMIERFRSRRSTAAAVVSAMGLALLAACGGESSQAASTDGLRETSIDVGPFANFTLPWVAQELGYFEDEGLPVELVINNGGATVQLPLVTSGKLDIGASSAADVIPAIATGAPLKLLANAGSVLTEDLEKSSNMLIYKDPAITSAKDLEGRTVAFNTIGGAQEALVRLAVEEDGGDPDQVDFVQLPVQNIPKAIDEGKVDAGQGLEPFLQQARELKLRELLSIGNILPGAPEFAYWTSASWADEHPKELAAFQRAIGRAAVAAAKDPGLVRTALEKYGKIDPAVAANVRNVGQFTDEIPVAKFAELGDLLTENGLATSLPRADQWVLDPQA